MIQKLESQETGTKQSDMVLDIGNQSNTPLFFLFLLQN